MARDIGGGWLERRAPAALAVAAVLALVAWAVWARLGLLCADERAVGVDGYYYAVQLRALLEHGQLHYASAPVSLWLMLPFAAGFGVLTGAKVAAAVLTALAAVPGYLVVRRLTRSRAAGVLSAALLATSAQGFFLSTEFVKQGIALTLLLCALAALAAWRDPAAPERSGWRRWLAPGLAVGFALATAFAHKLAFGLLVIFMLRALVLAPPAGLRSRAGVIAAGVAVAALVVAILVSFGARDLATVRELLGHAGRMHHRREVWLAAAAAVSLAVTLALTSTSTALPPHTFVLAILAGPAAIGLFLLVLPFATGPNALGPRLRLCAFIPLALCAPVALSRLAARLHLPPRIAASALLALALAIVVVTPRRPREGVVRTPPAVLTLARLATAVPADALIITTERRLAYFITWATRLSAPSHPPAPIALDPARSFRVLPGFAIPRRNRRVPPFERALPAGLAPIIHLDPGAPLAWLAFPEDTYRAFLDSLPPDERASLEPWRSFD
ncbi:MAG: phospholipid carrier-dependent glycosyltransferase [Deltaproteobacteria bacterium]|nr:phospholipid carrier-dependent glycosyltransferase [Deltaproteobacteria bacterium]